MHFKGKVIGWINFKVQPLNLPHFCQKENFSGCQSLFCCAFFLGNVFEGLTVLNAEEL